VKLNIKDEIMPVKNFKVFIVHQFTLFNIFLKPFKNEAKDYFMDDLYWNILFATIPIR
jgi:hypothetical protein